MRSFFETSIGISGEYENIDLRLKIHQKAIKMWLNTKTGTLDDPKAIAKDVSNIGHWGNGDYEIQIINDEDLEYIFSLIKQLYRMRKAQ